MPQDSATVNHMFGFKGSYCASPRYNRVRYKKWPWVSFLVTMVCIGIIFFIAGSPVNIHQMNGGALVLCSILLALGILLLIPSTVVVVYLGVYYLMVYFKCSARECCARPVEWANKLNADSPDDESLFSNAPRDENDNPMKPSKNKKKQDQESGSKNKLAQLSVPAIIVEANHMNQVQHKEKQPDEKMVTVGHPSAHSSVYSVEIDVHSTHQDDAYKQRRREQSYNRTRQNRNSRHNRELPKVSAYDTLPYRGRPDGQGISKGLDNASYDPDVDESRRPTSSKKNQSSPVHSYKHTAGSTESSFRSQNGPYKNRRTPQPVYGVSRAPNLSVGPLTPKSPRKSPNPPSVPDPPTDTDASTYSSYRSWNNKVHHSTTRSSPSSDGRNHQRRPQTKQPGNHNQSTTIEMRDYSIHKKKTLAEQAKEAPRRPPPQVRGHRSTKNVPGYLDTSLSENRAGSSNFNANIV